MKGTTRKAETLIEPSLKDSEVRYRRLFEAAQDGILILDAKTGMIEDVNPYLIKMLGYSRKEFLKKRLCEVGAFKDIEASQDAFEALQENKYIRYEDLPLKGKDGRLIQVEFVSNVYLVGGKKVIQCNIRDITERKKAETAQGDSEERYRSTLESMMEGCQIIGYDWRYLFINDSAAVQGKLKKEEFLGHTMMECYPGIEKTDMFAVLRRCMDERTSHTMVNEFVYPDGSKGWFELSIQPVPNGIFILSSDTTERKGAEEALSESRAQLAGIIDSAMNAIITADADQCILGFNLAAEKMFGFPAAQAIGQPLAMLLPNRFRGMHRKQVASFGDDGKTTRTMENLPTLAGVRANGEEFPVEISVSRVEVAGKRLYTAIVRDITERKQAEETLHDSHEELYRLLNSIAEGAYGVDINGNCTFVNRAFLQILGYQNDHDLLGKHIHELIHHSHTDGSPYPSSECRMYRAHQNNQPINVTDEVFWRKDGVAIPVEYWSHPIVKDDVVIGSIATFIDITERKQAEQALRRSEEKYRDLVNSVNDGIFVSDDRGVLTFANQALARMHGFERPEELVGRTFLEFIAPAMAGNIAQLFRESIQSGTTAETIEAEIIRANGIGAFVEIKPVPIVENGKVMGVRGVVRDITERKQREEQMTRLNMAVNNSGEAIFMTDREGVITFVNPGFTQLYGYTADEIVGKTTPRILKSGVMKPEDYAAFWQILLNKQVAKGELTNKTKGGPLLNIESWSSPILNQQEEVIGFLSLQRDITQRKQAEQEIAILAKFPSENPNPVLRLNRDGIVMYANIASGSLLGMWGCAIGGSAPQFWRDLAAQALARRENKTVDIECDGKVYSMVVTPVAESGYVNLYGRDITEHERAEERIRRQLEHLTALSAIERFIASVFDLKLSLSEILTHVTKELGVDAADILILNPNSPMLEYGAERGFRTKDIRKVQVRLGESYAGRAALERQLVRIQNLRDEPDNLYMTTLLADEDFVCYYGLPLIFMGRVKGVLEVFHRAELEPDAEWFNFLYALAGQAAIAIENATLFENLNRSNLELTLAYDATIEGWSHALDLRDKETEGHTQRVTGMTVKLARTFGSSEEDLVHIRRGALLHDIGKMGIPDGILLKPGPLTAEEWVVMKKHPAFAYEMLSPIRYLHAALDIPYCHHEKWDGTGYPRGLKGEQIPLTARIFAVVDVWDALTSDRPYRAAWPEEKVLDHIRSLSGTHFDPQVVKIFLESGLLEGQKSP